MKDENQPSVEELQAKLEEAVREKKDSEKKAAEYLDRLKRLQADMENLQKATKRQVDQAISQASEKLTANLLPVLDSLQQAENIAHSGNSLPPDEIAVGLGMLHKQLSEVLAAEGLQEIPAVNQPLDLERHEVVSYVETDEKPENMVVEEVRKGYMLNGKVLRPSLVIVTRRPFREGQSPEEESESDGP